MFLTLKNQKCMVFQNRMTPFESQSDTNCYYEKFSIRNPEYFERTEHGWEPRYGQMTMENGDEE